MASSRFVALDGLRGLAALIVVVRHTSHFWGFRPPHIHLAVDVFFLLSGFVIAHSYEGKMASGALSAAGFMRARLVRLMPAYLIATIVGGIVLHDIVGGPRLTAVLLIRGAFMVPSGGATIFPLVFVAWSLFDELVINAIYAMAHPRLTTPVLLALSGACFAALVAAGIRNGHTDVGFYGTTFGIVEGFVRAGFGIFLGVVLFRVHERAWRLLPPAPPMLAVLLTCLILLAPAVGPEWMFDVAALLCFPILILAGARGEPLAPRLLLALGAAAYPVYLLHGSVHVEIERWVDVSRWAPISGFAFLTLMLALGIGFERWIERPARALAHRIAFRITLTSPAGAPPAP